MVKEITIGKTKKAYLTEEDIVETEEYFQQAVIISTQKNEIKPSEFYLRQ